MYSSLEKAMTSDQVRYGQNVNFSFLSNTLKRIFILSLLSISVMLFSTSSVLAGSGSISMDEDILIVNSENSEDILYVKILDANETEVFGEVGCISTECSFTIGTLETGTYTVVVTTTGDGFEARLDIL